MFQGYGGGEALRLARRTPRSNSSTSPAKAAPGSRLVERFPGIGKLGELDIEKWDPAGLPELDVLFASLPTGESKAGLAAVPAKTKIVDIGGDHRSVDGWTYGLADVWPDKIKASDAHRQSGLLPRRLARALAPLVADELVEPTGIIIDAKSGVSGAGRGGGDRRSATPR